MAAAQEPKKGHWSRGKPWAAVKAEQEAAAAAAAAGKTIGGKTSGTNGSNGTTSTTTTSGDGEAGAVAAVVGAVVGAPLKPLKHLVLNLDVNKTILMVDSVTGKSAGDIVNAVLASAAWGVVTTAATAAGVSQDVWTIAHFDPCVDRPAAHMTSYFDFIKQVYPPVRGDRAAAKANKLRRDGAGT